MYTLFFLHETRRARPRRQRAGPQEDEATEAFGSPALTALRRPSRARRRGKGSDRTGYAHVLRDRRFLAFCAVSLLPLFCFGQLDASLPLLVPILGGVLLDGLGSHTSYGLIIACGLVGAGLYMLLRAPRRAGESTRLASWRGARS